MTSSRVIEPARLTWLKSEYVDQLSEINYWPDSLKAALRHRNFGQFRAGMATYITKRAKQIKEHSYRYFNSDSCDGLIHDTAKPKGIEWAFVVKTLWNAAGMSDDMILASPGTLVEEYKTLIAESNGESFNTSKEIENMNIDTTTVPFQTKTFIFGVDAEELSDNDLINAIKKLEAAIEELGQVKTASKKIAVKEEEFNGYLKSIVAILDAR